MGSRFRTVAVMALVTFAVGIVGVASASAALPEILNKEGNALVKKRFTGTTGARSVLEGEDGFILECTEAKSIGEVTGPTSGTLTTVYQTCGNADYSCSTDGHLGEVSLSYTFAPVYLNSEKSIALLYSLPSTGTTLECGSNLVTLHGSYLSDPIKANHLATKYVLVSHQTKGKQEYRTYENAAGEKTQASLELTVNELAEGKAGIRTENEATFEEELQFKN
jgi:hypothetical protein